MRPPPYGLHEPALSNLCPKIHASRLRIRAAVGSLGPFLFSLERKSCRGRYIPRRHEGRPRLPTFWLVQSSSSRNCWNVNQDMAGRTFNLIARAPLVALQVSPTVWTC